jgi:hypothetical protein
MSKKPRWVWIAASVALFAWAPYAAAQSATFQIEETTIAAVHRAMLRHELSCVELVQQYLSRIEQHNKVLHAIIHVNPNAVEIARKLDASLASSGTLSGALHCVPVAVKDAIDTAEKPTSGGSTAPFARLNPPADATVAMPTTAPEAAVLDRSCATPLYERDVAVCDLHLPLPRHHFPKRRQAVLRTDLLRSPWRSEVRWAAVVGGRECSPAPRAGARLSEIVHRARGGRRGLGDARRCARSSGEKMARSVHRE